MLQRLRTGNLPLTAISLAGVLTLFGIIFVTSATYDPDQALGMGREARAQLQWWLIALVAAVGVGHVRLSFWKELAWPLYVLALLVIGFMIAAADTPLVPRIKGQANWIVLGSLRVQPVEMIKLATLIALARLLSYPWFNVREWQHLGLALVIAGLPSALIAKSADMGSALTFVPMAAGVLVVSGMRFRHFAMLALAVVGLAALVIAFLPRDGYQWKRIQAWQNPDAYALAEAYQTARSVRSIGSGQGTGKGWAAGDQNRLGWVPEKHTDLILAVVGEETGFAGTLPLVLLIAGFGAACLIAAGRCRDPAGTLLCAGFASLIVGQASINLAVATNLMPVTGVTLPFISYGGSSLLACWIGVGLVTGACADRKSKGSLGGLTR